MSPGTKAALVDRAAAALESIGAVRSPAWTTWFVPGRLEVLGKHTDYAGGRSVICALERGFAFVAIPRPGGGRVSPDRNSRSA